MQPFARKWTLRLVMAALLLSQDPRAKLHSMEPPTGDRDVQHRLFQGYKTRRQNEQLLLDIAKIHPESVRVRTLGRTHFGNDIPAILMTDDPDARESSMRPSVYLNCAHHALELMSTEFCLDLAWALLQPENRAWLSKMRFWIVPILNPDGNDRYWNSHGNSGRKNGRDTLPGQENLAEGVDLNRNYPFGWSTVPDGSSGDPLHAWYRGPAPASEPEVRAVMNLAEQERFVLSLSFHTVSTAILVPYTIPGLGQPEPDIPMHFARILANSCETTRPDKPKYIVKRRIYAVDGTDQDWLYFTHGTIALLVEGAFHNPDYPIARRSVQAFREGFFSLLSEWEKSPRLEVRVVDQESGLPRGGVEVEIDDISRPNGESRTTDRRFGIRRITLLEPGTVRVRVTVPGGTAGATSWQRVFPVQVLPGLNRVEIQIPVHERS